MTPYQSKATPLKYRPSNATVDEVEHTLRETRAFLRDVYWITGGNFTDRADWHGRSERVIKMIDQCLGEQTTGFQATEGVESR